MFRIAILVNENEVAHSAFADTLAILKRPVALGDQKLDTYRFFIFDKYNVHRLFLQEDENYLANFDSLIVATNATNNIEVLNALRNNVRLVDEFLQRGKGVLISSQKKLSQKLGEKAHLTGFLPERYEYGLYDRPEASSADGTITETAPADRIFSYPNIVTNELIEYHCTNNSFMAHKYRSHIVPLHASQYLPLLTDIKSPPVPKNLRASLDPNRTVLLRSGSIIERLVITSMALDWAGHEELLENILVYITEGTSQIAVLRRRRNDSDKAMDAYVIRARVAKIPVREYFDVDPSEISDLDNRTLIVSPAYSLIEVDQMWKALTAFGGRGTDLYHMTSDGLTGGFQLCQRSNSRALDSISGTAAAWLARSFFPTLWGKSIWTYNYVLPMMIDLGINIDPYIPLIFSDICKHVPTTAYFLASYDNVINASTQMLEILAAAFIGSRFTPDAEDCSLSPQQLYDACAKWILGKLTGSGAPSMRDRLYMLNSLSRSGYLDNLNDEDVRRKVWEYASDTLNSYRAKTYLLCDTVESIQVLELALGLGAAGKLSESSLNKDVSSIIELLRSRQGPDGEWRNISETGEVTLALLQISQKYQRLTSDEKLTEAILRGMESILRNYDVRLGNWSDDINATAKAAHAIALFDRQRRLSANDFFADIQVKMEFLAQSEALEAGLIQNGKLLATLFRKETELAETVAKVATAEDRLSGIKERLRRYRVFTFGAAVIALISASTLFLVFAILFGSYPHVAAKLVGNWHDYIISAFVGIVLTLAFMGIYSTTKGKILKEDS